MKVVVIVGVDMSVIDMVIVLSIDLIIYFFE